MTKAMVLHETGGPENLKWEDWDVRDPAPGEALVRHTFVGLNYNDTNYRRGIIPLPQMPAVIGREAAGVVEAVGASVGEISVGMRVAYAGHFGAYGEFNNVPADRLVPIPDDVADDVAAAMLLKGMTAQYLVRQTKPLKAGDTMLYHAAAGGVGQIACQWANHLGATVIGTVSTREKAAIAKEHGCHHVIVYTEDDFLEQVKDLTEGQGVDYVCDAVGKDTIEKSMQCMKHHGVLVVYGSASGAPAPETWAKLPVERFLVKATLPGYTRTRERLLQCANDVFDVVRSGAVNIEINQRYALKDAAQAHIDLQGRKTTGSTVFEVA